MCLTVCALCTHSFLPPFERLKGGSQYDAGGVSIMSIVGVFHLSNSYKVNKHQVATKKLNSRKCSWKCRNLVTCSTILAFTIDGLESNGLHLYCLHMNSIS